MGNVGYIALLIALLASVYSTIFFALGAKRQSARGLKSARIGMIAVSALTSISVLILLYAIFTHNFKLEYVASYTSLHTSPLYLFSALWAGNSGSLLFWAWLLSIITTIVILTRQGKKGELAPYAAMVLMAVQTFFLLLLVVVTDPFNQLASAPADGSGLNPMLQNIGMVVHPPTLLAGYVIFAVPFAFAISTLVLGKNDDEWLATTRRWMLAAWLLLGIGNIIGAWWAYVELGWGGYWAWDPVENAGLMPWLLATAFLHSSVMQRRKGTFKVWNVVLIVLVFCLVIFGTFITRSGILSSVHTFSDTGMAPYFIVFLMLAFLGSMALIYYRYEKLKSGGSEAVISREGTFLLNNILLVGSTLVILLGTVFPAISESLRGVQVSLNASFFNKVNGPIFMAIILLIGVCTLIGWRQSSIKRLFKDILWPLVAALVLTLILFLTVVKLPGPLIAFFICSLVLFSIFSEWARGTAARRRSRGENFLQAWWNLLGANTQRYGGYVVHIGILLMAIGVIGSSFYSVEKSESLNVGDSINIKRYAVTFDGMTSSETPDQEIVSANLSIYNSGHLIGKLVSEKYFHKSQEQPVTEVAIRSNLYEDLYVILEGWRNNGAIADFKVLVNPLVSWIWIGGGVFLLGGLIAFWPGRKNKPAVKEAEDSPPAPISVNPVQAGSAAPGKVEIEDEIEEQVRRLRQQKGPVCPRCRSNNRAGSRFCARCGTSLVGRKKND